MNLRAALPWVSPEQLAARRRRVSAQTPPVVVTYEPEKKKIFWISGLWNIDTDGRHSYQSTLLRKQFPECSFETIVTPGHNPGDTRPVSLQDWALSIRKRIAPHGPCTIFAHSAGVAASVLCENQWPELVEEIVMLAGSPLKAPNIPRIPFQWKFAHPRYLKAMALGQPFRLTEPHERFTRSQIVVNFGQESGLVARQVLLRTVPCVKMVRPSLVIAAEHDQFMPVNVQVAMRDFHESAWGVVDGTHMFHCDPSGAASIATRIRDWWADRKVAHT